MGAMRARSARRKQGSDREGSRVSSSVPKTSNKHTIGAWTDARLFSLAFIFRLSAIKKRERFPYSQDTDKKQKTPLYD